MTLPQTTVRIWRAHDYKTIEAAQKDGAVYTIALNAAEVPPEAIHRLICTTALCLDSGAQMGYEIVTRTQGVTP